MDVKTYKQLDSKIDCQTDRHLDGQMDEWLKQNISVQMCLCNGHGGQIERNHTRKSTVRWTDTDTNTKTQFILALQDIHKKRLSILNES